MYDLSHTYVTYQVHTALDPPFLTVVGQVPINKRATSPSACGTTRSQPVPLCCVSLCVCVKFEPE